MATEPTTGVHHLGDGIVNFYVLREGQDLALVDPQTCHALLYCQPGRALAQIGRSIRDVRAVLLTHAHLDHIGLAERIRREVERDDLGPRARRARSCQPPPTCRGRSSRKAKLSRYLLQPAHAAPGRTHAPCPLGGRVFSTHAAWSPRPARSRVA